MSDAKVSVVRQKNTSCDTTKMTSCGLEFRGMNLL